MKILSFGKKKTAPAEEKGRFTCPQNGCSFSTNDNQYLQRHIEWKHPGLVQTAGHQAH